MEFDIYVNTTRKIARASLTGIGVPSVAPVYQTHLLLNVRFFEEGSSAALLTGSPDLVVAFKDANNPSSSVLLQLTAPSATGTDVYQFEWPYIDSVPLNTLLGENASVPVMLEIRWTIAGVIERVQIPCSIANAYARISDTAPDFTPLQVIVTPGGFGQMTLADGTQYHWPLNTGAAPA